MKRPRLFGRDRQLVSLQRAGGSPPGDNESLEVATDGSFRMWRANVSHGLGGEPVGRFEGRLADDDHDRLRSAAEACGRAPAVEMSAPPDAAVERVRVGSRRSRWAEDQEPSAPWDALAGQLRRLLVSLTAQPVAAVALERAGEGARLRHLGAAEVELDLSNASVRAVRWEGDAPAGDWRHDVDGPASVTAGPGWTFELPFDHGLGAGTEVTAHVDGLLAFDGRFWTACSLATPRPA